MPKDESFSKWQEWSRGAIYAAKLNKRRTEGIRWISKREAILEIWQRFR